MYHGDDRQPRSQRAVGRHPLLGGCGRGWLCALLAATALCGWTPPALAQTSSDQTSNASDGTDTQSDDHFNPAASFTSGMTLVSSMVFGGASIVFATHYKSWMPASWAWTQLVVGAGGCIGAGLWTTIDGEYGLGVANLIIGTWLAIHSILSLIYYREPTKERPDKLLPKVTAFADAGAQLRWSF